MSLAPLPFSPPTIKRWTRDEYHRLAEVGLIRDRHIQLLDGEIIEMAPQGEPHATAITLTDYALRPVFNPSQYTIRIQLPLNLGPTSEPEPDLAIILGTPRSFTHDHPTTAALIIEVSGATLDFDRRRKSLIYAAAQIPEYWIVDLQSRQLLVFRSPTCTAGRWDYASLQTLSSNDSISPLSAAASTVRIADLLP